MKKEYKTPKAKKLEFDYQENVVASNGSLSGGATGSAINGCYKSSNAANASGKCVAKYS